MEDEGFEGRNPFEASPMADEQNDGGGAADVGGEGVGELAGLVAALRRYDVLLALGLVALVAYWLHKRSRGAHTPFSSSLTNDRLSSSSSAEPSAADLEDIRQRRLRHFGDDKSRKGKEKAVQGEASSGKKDTKIKAKTEVPVEKRIHTFLTFVFAVALTEAEKASLERRKRALGSLRPTSPKVHVLPNLASELESNGQSNFLLGVDHIDSILLEVLPAMNTEEVLPYLIDCFVRAQDHYLVKNLPDEVLSTVKRSIATQAGLHLQGISFHTPVSTTHPSIQLLRYLEALPGSEMEIPQGLLTELVKQFESDGLHQIFRPIFIELWNVASRATIMDSHMETIRVLVRLAGISSVGKLMPEMQNWNISDISHGKDVELRTFLGPFFKINTFPDAPGTVSHFFPDPLATTRPTLENVISSLRVQLHGYHEMLHELSLSLLKNTATRERTLEWFAQILRSNRERTKMHMDRSLASSEGFLLNANSTFLKLCSPFADLNSPKLKIIDPTYFVRTTRVDVSKETKLAASSEEIARWLEEEGGGAKQGEGSSEAAGAASFSESSSPSTSPATSPSSPLSSSSSSSSLSSSTQSFGFVTEIFFLTHYALHVGLVKTCTLYQQYNQMLARLHKKMHNLQNTRSQWAGSPQSSAMDASLARLKSQVKAMLGGKFCMDAQLLDPELLQSALNFYAFSAKWLMHLVDPEQRGLPLSSPSMVFRALPQFVVEDMIEFVLFVFKFSPESISTSLAANSLVGFLVLFLGSSEHVKNPYLRSKLVEVLYEFSPDADRDEFRRGYSRPPALPFVFTELNSNPLAQKYLIPSLIRLYVDIEITGRHAQFYDKFFVRRHIALLLKYLRTLPQYDNSIEETSEDEDLFLRFVNMLINDATFLLDEVLKKLGEIHEIEQEMQDRTQWEAQSEERRREREEQHSNNESYTSTFGVLANETLILLQYLSEHAPTTFLRPEMIDRIAVMLNYYIVELSSPQSQQLQIWDPKKYNFTPKQWLKQIVEVYLHFARHPNFKEAVARDGRSFTESNFRRVMQLLSEQHIVAQGALREFEAFIEEAAACKVEEEDMESDMGEIPDEFLDPITCALMTDPVTLPSGHVVDRPTIARHLLSDGTNPFTRAPLSLDMLQPNDELRDRIAQFRQATKGKKKTESSFLGSSSTTTASMMEEEQDEEKEKEREQDEQRI
ncbi:putative ubiquitin conjugation factor E4 [Balamuthia mandrillaris]